MTGAAREYLLFVLCFALAPGAAFVGICRALFWLAGAPIRQDSGAAELTAIFGVLIAVACGVAAAIAFGVRSEEPTR